MSLQPHATILHDPRINSESEVATPGVTRQDALTMGLMTPGKEIHPAKFDRLPG